MRKTASEVLHELQVRVARLESKLSGYEDAFSYRAKSDRNDAFYKAKSGYNDAFYKANPTPPSLSHSERRKHPANIEYAEELASSIKKKLEKAGYRVEHYRDWHKNAVVSNPLGIDFPNSNMSEMEELISHMARTTGIGKGRFKRGQGYVTYTMVFHPKNDPSARSWVRGGVELTLRVEEDEGASFSVSIR